VKTRKHTFSAATHLVLKTPLLLEPGLRQRANLDDVTIGPTQQKIRHRQIEQRPINLAPGARLTAAPMPF
jgi:hypothetical protein